jgi:hypothetical protein
VYQPDPASKRRISSSRRCVAASRCAESSAISSARRSTSAAGIASSVRGGGGLVFADASIPEPVATSASYLMSCQYHALPRRPESVLGERNEEGRPREVSRVPRPQQKGASHVRRPASMKLRAWRSVHLDARQGQGRQIFVARGASVPQSARQALSGSPAAVERASATRPRAREWARGAPARRALRRRGRRPGRSDRVAGAWQSLAAHLRDRPRSCCRSWLPPTPRTRQPPARIRTSRS